MTGSRVSRPPRPKPSTAWLRLLAAVVFTAIPAVGLPVFIHHLYAVRPHVTDARGGFVLPHFRDGVAYYFAHSDAILIRGLSFWLLAAVVLLIFVGGQMMRRRLKQWLKPPLPPDEASAAAAPEDSDRFKT